MVDISDFPGEPPLVQVQVQVVSIDISNPACNMVRFGDFKA
jgi:hypothetical protein